MNFLKKPLLLILVLAALVMLPILVGNYQTTLLTLVLIYALLAMSVDIMAGFAGRTPLCHGAIFGCATYGMMYYVSTLGGSTLTGALFGIGLALIVTLIFAILAVRTSGVYFLLLTLALGMIIWGVCQRWTSVSGGENGIRGNIRPDWLMDPFNFYYLVLVVVMIASWVMWRFVKSPFGLSLKGIRESESRMRSLGYNTTLHLILGFLFSGLMAGLAGVLYALFNSFVSPSTVALTQSVKGLLMIIIGGVGTLLGGFVGAALIMGLENIVSSFTERWSMVLGFIFIFTVIYAPEGILGKILKLRNSSSKKSTLDHPNKPVS